MDANVYQAYAVALPRRFLNKAALNTPLAEN
jgi:hypothetical protein